MIETAEPAAAATFLSLAFKDIELLPAEQRTKLLCATAAAMLHSDPDRALATLGQAITALNDAARNPRRGRFNPRTSDRSFNIDRDLSTDSGFIVFGNGGAYEVLETAVVRYNFTLNVPGLGAFDVSRFVANANVIELKRLELTLLEIREETRQAAALNAFAAARTKR